jgi:hypothetical protein
VHLDLDDAVALAGLAAAALDVEAEAAGLPAAGARLGELGEELADLVEGLGVGAGVGAGGAADGALVDGDDLVEGGEALDALVGADAVEAAVSLCERAGRRMPLTSELLPAPLTPVTASSTPSGKLTSTFLRLCSAAPLTSTAPRGLRRWGGTAMALRPDR